MIYGPYSSGWRRECERRNARRRALYAQIGAGLVLLSGSIMVFLAAYAFGWWL